MGKVYNICNRGTAHRVTPKNMLMRVLFFLSVFFFAMSSCRFTGGKRVTGNGNMASENRNLSGFSGIEIAGPFDVYLSQGTEYSVRIEGDQNLLEYVETEQHGDILEIGSRDGFNIRPKKSMKVYITAPRIEELEVAGSGSIVSQTAFSSPGRLKMTIAGSGDISLGEVDAPEIQGEIAGSGSITVKGTTRLFQAEIAGSGEIHAFNLLSETTDVEIAGSGDVEVFASKTLDVSIAGAGDVKYKGSPTVSQSKAGSGSVRKVD